MKIPKFLQGVFGKKSHEISLMTHEKTEFFPLLGSNFKFGTQSKDFLVEAYGLNPYVYMVIDRISTRASTLEKYLVKKSDNEILIDNSEMEAVLLKPNSKEDISEFLYRVDATYLAAGECFIVKVLDEDKNYQYVCPINYNVIINQDTKGNVLNYNITMYGNSSTYLPYEVMHIYKPDITLDINNGFSPLRAGRKVYESNNEVWSSEAALHRNKGISGVLFGKGQKLMNPTEQKELQDAYDQKYTGVENFGKVRVSSTELGYVQMGMNPNDLQSVQTRIEHLRTICALYNVDSKIFGDYAASTYNNMQEAQKAMIVNAVLPLTRKIYPKLISFIGIDFSEFDVTWKIDKDLIPELSQPNIELSNKIIAEVNAGILTPEQGNQLLYPNGI